MLRIFLLLLCLFAGADSFAQFSDSLHYLAGFASTGSLNRTNSGDAYLWNNTLRFGIRRKDISLNNANNFVYGKQNGQLTNNDVSSSVDFNLYRTLPHFYYWGLGNFTSSYSLKIINQLQGGAGIAYSILDKNSRLINISDGVLYELSDVYIRDTLRDDYHTFRNSLRLSVRWKWGDLLSFNGTCFMQHSLSYSNDYILKANAGLSLQLRKWLAFNTSLAYNKISRTGRENLLITYGLVAERYYK